MSKTGQAKLWIAALTVGVMCCLGTVAEATTVLSAVAAVEKGDVFVGESFIFQIQVNGSNKPDDPGLQAIPGFRVETAGHRENSSTSIRIVNGRMTKDVRQGYVFSYRLTPTRAGTFLIPAINVRAEGRTVRTEPVQVMVKEPQQSPDFELRTELSKAECYVGEQVTFTLTWYIGQGQQPRDITFSLPIFDEPSFSFPQPEIGHVDPRAVWNLGTLSVIPHEGRGTLKGKPCTTISFAFVFIPNRTGTFDIPAATLGCSVLTGYRQTQRRSPFGAMGDMFSDDFFGRGRQGVYQKVVVPSSKLRLQVRDVPTEGRPADFAGHVGRHRIETSAAPVEVSVGDPITLTVTLSGPAAPEQVRLPPLQDQEELARDFQIPKEMAPGEVQGRTKVFTQTIRAKHADVTHIPPLRLVYFDTDSGTYKTAMSRPIPITVKFAERITIDDIEGPAAAAVRRGRELESWARGIAHNYENIEMLEDQRQGPELWLRSPAWLSLLGGAPLTYLAILLGTVFVRRRNADPLALRARRAHSEFHSKLGRAGSGHNNGAPAGGLFEAVRTYFGAKFGIPSGALTFRDIEPRLRQSGLDEETLGRLAELFATCERAHYAGSGAGAALDQLKTQATAVIDAVNRKLG